ncbi:MAG TPA: hypothetical protein DDW34_02075 [Clostridium sp.]|nr:hypothetical protein [Clostridium sp.]
MGKFEFRKNVIELDIAGEIYEVPGSTEFLHTVSECGERMVARSAEMKEEGSDLGDTTDFMLQCLEEILGVDAVDSIFAEREPDFYDCTDLFEFVTREIKEHHARKLNSLAMVKPVSEPESIPQISQNRAARRAAERRKNRK